MEKQFTSLDLSLKYCNNCGSTSHCGTRLMRTERRYEVEGAEEYEIEVCGHCRCKECN